MWQIVSSCYTSTNKSNFKLCVCVCVQCSWISSDFRIVSNLKSTCHEYFIFKMLRHCKILLFKFNTEQKVQRCILCWYDGFSQIAYIIREKTGGRYRTSFANDFVIKYFSFYFSWKWQKYQTLYEHWNSISWIFHLKL